LLERSPTAQPDGQPGATRPVAPPIPARSPAAEEPPPGPPAHLLDSPSFLRRVAFPGELHASIIAGLLLVIGFALSWSGAAGWADPLYWTSLGLGMVYGGRAALQALAGRKFDIDVLMVIAAGLAAAVGHPEDGALLLFLFVLAGALEDRAMQRTKRAVEALHKLMPTAALVLREGQWREVDPQQLRPGERIRIRTGELIPADSRILTGQSSIDQATLTGESLPREVAPDDELFAGTLNLDNPIEAEVLRAASESSLQRILDLVTSAQEQREPIQRAIDRVSQPYAIGVMAVSIGVFLVWWLLLGQPLMGTEGKGGALYTAIALLIVGSPCALIIATPTATLAAISRAARAGLLFKGGQAIERLARMGAVALDKTGTLTQGRPRLQQVHAIAWSEQTSMLAVAAALEAGSTHPIATAVVQSARERRAPELAAESIQDIPGAGISGVVGGAPARLGTYEHCEPLIPECLRARAREVLERIRSRGQLGVVVAWQRGVGSAAAGNGVPGEAALGQAAVLILSDTVRAGAKSFVDRLHAMGISPVRMLTGDNRISAAYIAQEVGIDRFDAELLPEDKVRLLEEMRADLRAARGGAMSLSLSPGAPRRLARGVGVIGDGVNDAPAMAAADVSIAIGSIGSDAALESADIVLLNDDLTVIPWAVRLARRARGIVVFNLALALGIIAGMGVAVIVGSLLGYPVPLAIAVLAHEGGTLLVVANSLRLLAASPPHQAPSEKTFKDILGGEFPSPAGAAVQ
jgi:Zn2+/Cd2+-exporting ATPase